MSAREGGLQTRAAPLVVEVPPSARAGPLVYNQSWEDPEPDLAALAPGPADRVFTVASGGCNVLHLALTGAGVAAADRNAAQVALTEIKVAAALRLEPAAFRRIFERGLDPDGLLEGADLSPLARRLLRRRGWFGGRGLYAAGVFGRGGRLLRAWVRASGAREAVEAAFGAATLEEQATRWRDARRLLRRGPGRAALATPLPLLAFGVPPRVARGIPGGAAAVADRVDEVLTRLPARENWFWQRVLLDEYRTARPPYLEADPLGLGPVTLVVADLLEALERADPGGFDGAVLLDALHWLAPGARAAAWRALHRALRPGGRVTLRRLHPGLAAPPSLFEEAPAPGIDRTGCYESVAAYVRR